MSILLNINSSLLKRFKEAHRLTDQQLAELVRDLTRQYKLARKNILFEISEAYRKYGDAEGVLTFEEMAKYNRMRNLEKQIDAEIKSLYGSSRKAITASLKKSYAETYYYTGYALESSVGVKLGFGLLDSAKVEAAVLNKYDKITWPKRLQSHAQDLAAKVKQEVTQGLIQGKPYSETARMISKQTDISYGKAIRISQTETHRASMEGINSGFEKTQAAADRLGIEIEKVWTATLDNRTRDTHGQMDGQVADEDGMFTLPGGAKTAGPGLSGIAEEDINCRCTIRTGIKSIPPKVRRDNETGKIIKYQNYAEWKASKSVK